MGGALKGRFALQQRFKKVVVKKGNHLRECPCCGRYPIGKRIGKFGEIPNLKLVGEEGAQLWGKDKRR